jgi:POT family proton-dependent oligopeptide transporter
MAGVGMVGGLIQFGFSEHYLGDAGLAPTTSATVRRDWSLVIGALATGFLFVILLWTGILVIDPIWIAHRTAYVLVLLAIGFFGYLFLFGHLDANETKRVGLIAILFVAAALFFAGFEQQGSSFTLFADKFTQHTIGKWEVPTGWFQMINPIFVISLAPVVAATWLWLAKRRCEPSLGTKFGIALLLMGAGFHVMMVAAWRAIDGPVWPTWLIFAFLLHTIAELCLSPVGLSSVTKLAPPRFVGQMLGLWFLATAIGNLIAGLAAGEAATEPAKLSHLFQSVSLWAIAGGVLLLCLAWPMKQMMAGKE